MAVAQCPECGERIIIGLIKGMEEQGVKFFSADGIECFLAAKQSGDIFDRHFAIPFHKCPEEGSDEELIKEIVGALHIFCEEGFCIHFDKDDEDCHYEDTCPFHKANQMIRKRGK